MVFAPGEKPGGEPEEARLQSAGRQIVQTAIRRALQQLSGERRPGGGGRGGGGPSGGGRGRCQPGAREVTKKQEQK